MIAYQVGKTLKKIQPSEKTAEFRMMYLLSSCEFDNFVTNIAHKKTVMHFLCLSESTKIQFFSKCIVGTVYVPDKEAEYKDGMHLGFYISEKELYLIGDEAYTINLTGRMKDASLPENLTLCGLFCMILNILIDDDVSFLQKTEKSLIALEDSLNVCHDDAFDVRIMPYRRLMVRFQAYYYQLMNVGMSFRSNINNMLCEEDVMSFTYYTRRAEMLHVQVQALRDYIFQIRETYRTDIAVRQNRSMNLLTVISALFMPLTLIAGWYGMNFLYMPELKSPYGYSAVIAVSCVIVIAEIIYFRKKHIL